jgi:hypothetical protein
MTYNGHTGADSWIDYGGEPALPELLDSVEELMMRIMIAGARPLVRKDLWSYRDGGMQHTAAVLCQFDESRCSDTPRHS